MTSFLLSSAGRRGGLVGILQAVAADTGGGRVVAIDATPLSAAGQLADHFETVPRVDDPAFVDAVLDVVSRTGVDVVIPTIDTEIPVYADHRERFAQLGADVWAPSAEAARLAHDKWDLFTWLTRHDLPTVETFRAADAEWRAITGPVVAKPRTGSSSEGMRRATSVDLLPPGLGEDYLVQPEATGTEVTVDFAVDRRGRFLGAVPRRRLEVRAGEVSKAVTVRLPEAERVAEAIATEMPGLYGVANVQMFHDATTEGIQVIEVNARFGGGYPLAHAAGADFVTALLSSTPQLEWVAGLTMLRYDSAVYVHGDGRP